MLTSDKRYLNLRGGSLVLDSLQIIGDYRCWIHDIIPYIKKKKSKKQPVEACNGFFHVAESRQMSGLCLVRAGRTKERKVEVRVAAGASLSAKRLKKAR